MSLQRGFTLIAAVDDAGGIGRGGELPWRLKADMEFFRRTTTGTGGGIHAVILGRRTWESLPARFRPLPERRNIVVSRQPKKLPRTESIKATCFSDGKPVFSRAAPSSAASICDPRRSIAVSRYGNNRA